VRAACKRLRPHHSMGVACALTHSCCRILQRTHWSASTHSRESAEHVCPLPMLQNVGGGNARVFGAKACEAASNPASFHIRCLLSAEISPSQKRSRDVVEEVHVSLALCGVLSSRPCQFSCMVSPLCCNQSLTEEEQRRGGGGARESYSGCCLSVCSNGFLSTRAG
jgi:hypothetical protein